MVVNSPSSRPEDALAHLGWVRALALSLVRDANVAEDVVQQTYLLSLERPPSNRGRLAPWLARVTRTFARQEVRASRSRREREQVVARAATGIESEEPFEVYERGQRQRTVADAVLSLPEPYASTVLYHYLDGLATAQVAERMKTSPATVRKRLERARALLREQLDREFGCETDSWALGLLPLANLRAPTAATGAASAGATVVTASGLMGSKTIGLAVLMLVGGLFVLNRAYFVEATSVEERLTDVAPDTRSVDPELPNDATLPAVLTPEVRTNASAGSDAAPAAVSLAEESAEDGVVLLVRALAPDGSVLTAGHIDCFWDRQPSIGGSSAQQHIGRNIESVVTRIQLPDAARSVRVCVSHSKFPPSAGITLNGLRYDSAGANLEGVVVKEVDVQLVGEQDGLFVFGDIYVDGQRECPPGLRVFLNGAGYAWVNTITSCYKFGPLESSRETGSLFVVSDFSLPTIFEFDEDTDSDKRVDLQLKAGRELLVHAVDAATGAPAVGREVTIEVSNPVKKTLFKVLSHGHEQRALVDAAGFCRFRGIPIEGQVAVMQRLDDGASKQLLERIYLKPKLPFVVECEVRLGSTETVMTRVFGTLPVGVEAGAEGLRTVRLNSFSGGGTQVAKVDAEGRWSADLESHQIWSACAELDGRKRSDDKYIELRGEAENGPVQLGWQGAKKLTLHLIDVPPEGRIEIDCTELEGGARQRHRLDSQGEDLDLVLSLSGRATVRITVVPEGRDSEFGLQRSIEVDPSSELERVVDLHGSRAMGLSFRIGGEPPPGKGELILVSPGDTENELRRVLFTLDNGQVLESQVIDAGRWFYLFQHEEYPGLVGGWLDVPEKPPKSLAIEWEGSARPTVELGSGLEIKSLAGRDLKSWCAKLATFPWRPNLLEKAALWLPADITYDVMK